MTTQPPLRISDAERDAAVTALGEHYAAGRLNKDEYDQRADQAWAAKYEGDLGPLFADLPGGPGRTDAVGTVRPERVRPATRRTRRRHLPHHGRRLPPVLWAVPVVLVAAVIVSGAPWLLFLLLWLWVLPGFGACRSGWRRPGQHFQ